MSDYKDKVTKGRVSVNKYGSLKVIVEDGHEDLLVSGVASPIAVHPRREEAHANALLLAEAINVLHETGLTPRELAEQRDRLLAALKWHEQFKARDGDAFGSSFERVAEAFHRDTGLLAPGKDCRLHDPEVRQEAWNAWIEAGIARTRAAIAACEAAP